MSCYGQTLAIDEGAYVFQRLAPCFRIGLEVVTADEINREQRSRALELLGIVESEGCGLIELSLNLRNQVEALNETALGLAFNDHSVQNRRNGNQFVPKRLIEEIEDLKKKLSFEREAFGEEVTQEWFCLERMAFRLCASISELSTKIVELHQQTFDHPLQALLDAKHYFVVAQMVQRGLESRSKSARHLHSVRSSRLGWHQTRLPHFFKIIARRWIEEASADLPRRAHSFSPRCQRT
jgi:hypothetical protein